MVKVNGNENFKIMTRKSQRRGWFEQHSRMQTFFKKRSKRITAGVSIPKQAWAQQRNKNCSELSSYFPSECTYVPYNSRLVSPL